MKEYYVKFNLIKFGYTDGYYYASNLGQAKQQVQKELITWGGGHANIYYNDKFVEEVKA